MRMPPGQLSEKLCEKGVPAVVERAENALSYRRVATHYIGRCMLHISLRQHPIKEIGCQRQDREALQTRE